MGRQLLNASGCNAYQRTGFSVAFGLLRVFADFSIRMALAMTLDTPFSEVSRIETLG